jgi:aspartate carbamoyltransferase catalytic subunit
MGAEVVVCAPPTLIPAELGKPHEDNAMPPLEIDLDLDHAVQGADAVMTLRLQHERMTGGLLPSLREYSRLYQVTEERMSKAHPGAPVLHPGPMNEGVEITAALAHGARSLIEEQVTNGVAVRMALLYLMRGNK